MKKKIQSLKVCLKFTIYYKYPRLRRICRAMKSKTDKNEIDCEITKRKTQFEHAKEP